MMSSLRFSNRQGKSSKKINQPPTLNTFDLFTSQDKEEKNEQQIQQLSNVEEKSYFQSEAEQPDHQDIQDFLGKMKQIGQRDVTPPRSPMRNQRLEDQQIIVVEEQHEVGSNLGENQSIILQHIEFCNDQHPESPPKCQRDVDKDEDRNKEEIKYVINYLGKSSPYYQFINDSENVSNSSPYDFESQEFRLNHKRNSKNTCNDYVEQLQSEKIFPNKSCIENPFGFDEEEHSPQFNFPNNLLQRKNKSQDVQHIFNKWNDQICPPFQNGHSNNEFGIARRASADFQIQRDAKFCYSKYKGQSSRDNLSKMEEIQDFSDIIRTSKNKSCDNEVQTDISGEQLLQNENYLSQQMSQLKKQNLKLQEKLLKLKEKLSIQHNQLSKIKEALKKKETQINNLKSSHQYKKWGQQSKVLSMNNKQLQKLVAIQNQTLRQYQDKNQVLSNQLLQTVSFNNYYRNERTPTFFGGAEFQPINVNNIQSFGPNQNLKWKKQAQQLQQYIFDLEQKFAGIDIEVERRVALITARLTQQNNLIIDNLKVELNQYKQAYRHLQFKQRENEDNWKEKEQQLIERQKEANRMYNQLIQERKEVERQSELQRKYSWRNQAKINHLSPSNLPVSHLSLKKPTINLIFESDKTSQAEQTPQSCYSSNKQLKTPNFNKDRINFLKNHVDNSNSVSYISKQDPSFRNGFNRLNETQKFNLNFMRALGEQNRWGRSIPKSQPRENSEITAINSKIQRLRKQINKQLCSIH